MPLMATKLTLILCLLGMTLQTHVLNGESRTLTIANTCGYTVWPVVSDSFGRQNFSLQDNQRLTVTISSSKDQTVSVWGLTQCHNDFGGNFVCGTEECHFGGTACAATTVNIEINEDGPDFYDVRVDSGYNIPVSVAPAGNYYGSSCPVTGCVFNVSSACPKQLQVGGACRGSCDTIPIGSGCTPADYFKKACPRAFDPRDNTTLFSCLGAPYTITFCPSSTSIIRELSTPVQSSLSPAPLPSPTPVPHSSPAPLLSPTPVPHSSPTPGKANWTGTTFAQPPTTTSRNTERKRRRSPTYALVAVAGVILILLSASCIFISRWKAMKRDENLDIEEMKTAEPLQFDISTIRKATNNFSPDNKLGKGGYGEVYKGKFEGGQEVAVKRLLHNSEQGVEAFKTEVVLVAKLQHKNLVKLVGFCVTSKEKLLIYEFLRNRSLDRFLFDQTRNVSLDWSTRLNIMLGIARGLLYLHEESRLKVIHRDLKTSNILLDESMNPKISDFGLAKLFGEDQTRDDTMRIVGTRGYMAPEYSTTGCYSVKSDVYGFGVIMLEMISGQQSKFSGSDEETMLHRAWRLWTENKPLEFVDTRLNNFLQDQLTRCFHIGLLCIQEVDKQRPSMTTVLDALSKPYINLPEPRPPSFLGTSGNSEKNHDLVYAYTGPVTITELSPRD